METSEPLEGTYAISYRVGRDPYWKAGFHSIQEAERFRITKTSAYVWDFFKMVDGKWKKILSSGAEN